MSRTFPWNYERHRNLSYALRDQISDDSTPLACIWEDARIGSYADPSLKSFSIDNEEIQAFTNCLNGDQRRNLDRGREVKVFGYNEDGTQQKMKLKIKDGHAVLEGPWGSIMQKNGWSRETRICSWGLPYGGRNGGEPCFVFTYNI
ncbi:hypothetical protein AAC387_Pa03g2543 [Persea americana]